MLQLKDKWGFADPRNTSEYKDCDICGNDIFRGSWKESGVAPRAFPRAGRTEAEADGAPACSADQETLIRLITDRVVEELRRQ